MLAALTILVPHALKRRRSLTTPKKTKASPVPHAVDSVSIGTLPLRLAAELPPNFAEPSWEHFQAMCRDLIDVQPEVAKCSIYAVSGQSQLGIDLLAKLKRSGAWVVQCKRYKKISPKSIRKASDEFLKHLTHWKTKSVKRFMLLTACDMVRKDVLEQIDIETARFRTHGLLYDAWDANQITNRLGPRPHIVHRYLGEQWADKLCGGFLGSSPRLPDAREGDTFGILSSNLQALGEVVDRDTEVYLSEIRVVSLIWWKSAEGVIIRRSCRQTRLRPLAGGLRRMTPCRTIAGAV